VNIRFRERKLEIPTSWASPPLRLRCATLNIRPQLALFTESDYGSYAASRFYRLRCRRQAVSPTSIPVVQLILARNSRISIDRCRSPLAALSAIRNNLYIPFHTSRSNAIAPATGWPIFFVQAPNAECEAPQGRSARCSYVAWRHLPTIPRQFTAILGSDSIIVCLHAFRTLESAGRHWSVVLVVGGIVIMTTGWPRHRAHTRKIGIRPRS